MRFWRSLWQFEWALASVGAGLCLVAMMMVTVISVFGRYVMQMDLVPGAYNIVERIIFPLLVLWALPVAHRDGIFPRLESIAGSLPPLPGRLVSIFVLVVEIAIYATLMWFVLLFVWQSIRTGRTMQVGIHYLPLWPVIVMMPLSFGLMIVEMARLLAADMRAIFRTNRAKAYS